MKFKPGDKVKFLNQTGEGVVTRILSQQLVSVAIEEGFEIPTLASELLKVELSASMPTAHSAAPSSLNEYRMPQPPLSPQSQSDLPERVISLTNNTLNCDNSVYLAFCPEDQQWLITGNISIYLMNPSEYDVLFCVFLSHPTEGWLNTDYDVLPAFSCIELANIRREELKQWQEGVVQIMFLKEKLRSLIAPVHATFRIRMSRFVKEDSYTMPGFFGQRMISLKLTEIVTAPEIIAEKEDDTHRTSKARPVKNEALIDRHRVAPWEAEVDLHISALSDSYGHMSKHEILKMQLDYFRRALDSALMNQYRKITFIHGIGNGALRDAIHQILQDYEELQVRQAPFQQYGYGAIEAINPNPQ